MTALPTPGRPSVKSTHDCHDVTVIPNLYPQDGNAGAEATASGPQGDGGAVLCPPALLTQRTSGSVQDTETQDSGKLLSLGFSREPAS